MLVRDSRTSSAKGACGRQARHPSDPRRKGAIAPCSWTPEEAPVESSEHQDNANIHCQPFPESVSEEREIYTDYDGYHRQFQLQAFAAMRS